MKMSKTIHLILLLMCSVSLQAACADKFVKTKNPSSDPKENQYSNDYYDGVVELRGQYEALEDGELCFVLEQDSQALLPYGVERVCFTNEAQAERLFRVSSVIERIDNKEICGIRGKGRIIVSGLITGIEDSARWYTTTLRKVLFTTPYTLLSCSISP
jgi:hypothetical protein